MWQLVDAAYKAYEICQFVGLKNKPGTAQVGAISKAQKDSKTKTTFSTTGDNKTLKKLKIEKKNSRFFFRNFFEASGKSHSAENCKRGTVWDFLIHSVAKYQKLMGGTIKKLSEKN